MSIAQIKMKLWNSSRNDKNDKSIDDENAELEYITIKQIRWEKKDKQKFWLLVNSPVVFSI